MANIKFVTRILNFPFLALKFSCNNVNNKLHTLRQNHSNVLTRKLLHVSSLAGPSSGSEQMTDQQGSKLVGVCVLKHYRNPDELCVICCSHCYSSITHITLSVKSHHFILCFLLGSFQESELYMSTFRNTLSVPSS